jgi:hypothetical protein
MLIYLIKDIPFYIVAIRTSCSLCFGIKLFSHFLDHAFTLNVLVRYLLIAQEFPVNLSSCHARWLLAAALYILSAKQQADVVALIDVAAEPAKVRGPHKPRAPKQDTISN